MQGQIYTRTFKVTSLESLSDLLRDYANSFLDLKHSHFEGPGI